jgi:hypothetical protein
MRLPAFCRYNKRRRGKAGSIIRIWQSPPAPVTICQLEMTMPDPTDQPKNDSDGTNSDDQGGKETIPQSVVVGVAAFVGGLVGAAIGSGLL